MRIISFDLLKEQTMSNFDVEYLICTTMIRLNKQKKRQVIISYDK